MNRKFAIYTISRVFTIIISTVFPINIKRNFTDTISKVFIIAVSTLFPINSNRKFTITMSNEHY